MPLRRHPALLLVPFSFLLVLSMRLPLSPSERPLYKKMIALTFDDGPRPDGTAQLVDLLERHHVRATFFVVGKMAARYPSLVRLLAHEGHEIAGHSWSHSDIRTMSEKQMKWELDRTRLLIEKITGVQTWMFRTPGGSEHYIRSRFKVPPEYQLVLWDVHSLDNEGISPDEIVDRIETQTKDGDVLLLHNGIANTVTALEKAIPFLREKGFEFVTVSELSRYQLADSRLYQKHFICRG